MKLFRILAGIAIMAAFATGVVAPPVLASGPSIDSTCASGEICLWSGANYTGTKLVISPEYPWSDCVSAASLGMTQIKSAKRNGVGCHMQASLHADSGCGASTEPEYIQTNTPNISPAALSLHQILIPC